jgi:NTE family protein
MNLWNLRFLFLLTGQIESLQFNYNYFFKSIQKSNLSGFHLRTNVNYYPRVMTPWDGNNIEALIFEGGGARAVVYCGVVECLEDNQLLSDIKFFSGTSSGAQMASLLAFGYNSTEMKEIFRLSPWDKILDRDFNFNTFKDIYQLTNEYGLYSGHKLEKFYDRLFENKIGVSNCTFNQLYYLTGVHLKIGVCNVNTQDFIYLDYLSNPDMPISKAIRASSAIPFIFTVTEWNNQLLIDGGIMGNLPTTAFLDKKCLACNLVSTNDTISIKKKPRNIFNYIRQVVGMILTAAQHQYGPLDINLDNIDIINIPAYNVSVLETNLSDEKFQILIQEGYSTVDFYLHG